jgi:hypothetical protein
MQHIKSNLLAFFKANQTCLDLAIQVNVIYYSYHAYTDDTVDDRFQDVSENLVAFIHKAFHEAYPQYEYDKRGPSDESNEYEVYEAIDSFINLHAPREFGSTPFINI